MFHFTGEKEKQVKEIFRRAGYKEGPEILPNLVSNSIPFSTFRIKLRQSSWRHDIQLNDTQYDGLLSTIKLSVSIYITTFWIAGMQVFCTLNPMFSKLFTGVI
jgi:hypothetical protein